MLDIRVTDIMDTYSFNAGLFASSDHFMVQKTFGVWEQSVIGLDFITPCHVIFQAFHQRFRDRHDPVAFWRFRRADHVSPPDALEGFIDGV